MYRDDFSDDPYQPSEEEINELNEILKKEDEKQLLNKKIKNRVIQHFATQSHFIGWLKVNGIKW